MLLSEFLKDQKNSQYMKTRDAGQTEYKNKCDICKENVKARIFYKKINNEWIYLCPECWEKQDKTRDWQDPNSQNKTRPDHLYTYGSKDAEEITVECNSIKCKNKWKLDPSKYEISGNRIVAGPMITCPKCGRMDRPYIVKDALPTIEFQGLQIAVENEVGSTREGTDKDGNKWSTTFSCPYGYILNTLGRDNEEVDVYIGKNKKSDKVFIVRQHIDDLPDEDKTFVGFDSPDQVEECYLTHGMPLGNLGPMMELPMEEFKKLTIK